jgi:hypothetical protein
MGKKKLQNSPGYLKKKKSIIFIDVSDRLSHIIKKKIEYHKILTITILKNNKIKNPTSFMHCNHF